MKTTAGALPVKTTGQGRWWSVGWRGTMVWVVPFVGTAPLVDPEGGLLVSFPLFKGVAVGLLLLVLLAVRRSPAPGWRPASAAGVYLGMSIVLDLVVLVGTLGVPAMTWAATVLPVYLLVPLVVVAGRRSP